MLKLVFHTGTSGSINLDYNQPLLTVGSDPGNDLVLEHPSVRPHHCQLEFLEDRVLVHAPAIGIFEPGTHDREYRVGDQLSVGELIFEIQPSAYTVAIPQFQPAPEPEFTGSGPLYFCAHCQRSYPLSSLTRIGLVARGKHFLCPKCSLELVSPEVPVYRRSLMSRMIRTCEKIANSFGPKR